MNNIILKDGERLDFLDRNGYRIIQNDETFSFSIDAVTLAHFASNKNNKKILDLGTGTGVIPILMESRTKNNSFVAFELQEKSYDMAKRSVEFNSLSDKIKIINDDVKNVKNYYDTGYFDIVTTNPPYMEQGTGAIKDNEHKAIARTESTATLHDFIKTAEYSLKYGGYFYMVHRPNRLVDIFHLMRLEKIEPKTIRFIQPFQGKEPNIVLIEGVKGGKPSLKILDNLIVYDDNRCYTTQMNDIYYN